MTVLAQIFKLISSNLIAKLAKEHGIDKRSGTFSPVSHILALMFGQLSHVLGRNDICDTPRNHGGTLSTIREATPQSHNGFSYADRNRNADMSESLRWKTLEHLETASPKFRMQGSKYCALPRRIKKSDHRYSFNDDTACGKLYCFALSHGRANGNMLLCGSSLSCAEFCGAHWTCSASLRAVGQQAVRRECAPPRNLPGFTPNET